MAERYIVVRNWERFQHYKDRRPLWIKSYLELLDDDAYLSLSLRKRGILHGIWVAYARSRCVLSAAPVRLGRLIGDESVQTRDLTALEQAGFLTLSASKPVAKTYETASPELEKEKETPKPPLRGKHICADCGLGFKSARRLEEHYENLGHEPPRLQAVGA